MHSSILTAEDLQQSVRLSFETCQPTKWPTEHGAELFCHENDVAHLRFVSYVVKCVINVLHLWGITLGTSVNISAGG